jgi:hypothetical protein
LFVASIAFALGFLGRRVIGDWVMGPIAVGCGVVGLALMLWKTEE